MLRESKIDLIGDTRRRVERRRDGTHPPFDAMAVPAGHGNRQFVDDAQVRCDAMRCERRRRCIMKECETDGSISEMIARAMTYERR